MYQEWLEASIALEKAKRVELDLRNQICEKILVDKLEGAKTVTDGNFKITATARVNRNIDAKVLSAIFDELTDEEKQAVEYKPQLRISLYKPIEESGGKLLEAVTVTPGQASLTIKYLG